MPKPFHQLSLDEFIDLLGRFPFTRRIDTIHMHHTWRPNRSTYHGLTTIEAMWRFHTQTNGWSDIAQHITIAPDGTIWTGRDWNQPPASATGFNGNTTTGPFMFEMIGDFDHGHDRFEGHQRETTLQVIAHLQTHFGLPVESLRFHNQMSQKSCPGTSIPYQEILMEVRQLRASLEANRAAARAHSLERPFGDEALAVREKTDAVLLSLPRGASRGAEPADAEPAEDAMSVADIRALLGPESLIEPAPGAPGLTPENSRALDLTPALLYALRPHVINLTQGQFSSDGLFATTPSDVDAIFGERLVREAAQAQQDQRRLRIVFYAHGGLVSEADGLRIAAKHVTWWKQNAIYPIYFVWETGFFETIGHLLFGIRQRAPRLAVRDIWDHTLDPLVETTARTAGGVHIWSGMKRSAALAVAENGGARYVAEKLKAFCDAHTDQVELHAVGHSAGAIFHAHFVPTAVALQVPAFRTVQFLAPAIRVDEFHQRLASLMGNGIAALNIFTMAKDWEKADNCAQLYHKSLLYLIYYALEPEPKTPILGLEESLRADPKLAQLFGLGGHPQQQGEMVWAKTRVTTGRSASTATSHGGFDDDGPTMNSVARRILDVPDGRDIADFPTEAAGRALTVWEAPRLWSEDLVPVFPATSGGTALPLRSPDWAMALPLGTPQVPAAVASGRDGRHRALCVGINRYPSAPLSGCVADARAWAQTLVQLGFESPLLLLDDQATRSAILDALKNLLATSTPGDVVVLQYAGHGTTLPDVNGDEIGGDSPGEDEAICPYDYNTGAFLIDDDLAEVFRSIPTDVNVTCFIDCCHSGTISRFAVGTPPQARGAEQDQRPRFIEATAEMQAAHRQFRTRMGQFRALGARGPEAMREAVFSACLSREVAWESGGHGDFTQHATRLLQGGVGGSNEEFQRRVVAAFGAMPRQHPELDCAPAVRARGLLQPCTVPSSPPAAVGVAPGAVADGTMSALAATIAQSLHAIAHVLEK